MLRQRLFTVRELPTVWLSSRLNRMNPEICVWLIQEVLRLKCRTWHHITWPMRHRNFNWKKSLVCMNQLIWMVKMLAEKNCTCLNIKQFMRGWILIGWRSLCIWGQVRSIHFLSNWVVVICVWWRHFPTITSLVSWKVLLVTPTMVPCRFPIVTKNSISGTYWMLRLMWQTILRMALLVNMRQWTLITHHTIKMVFWWKMLLCRWMDWKLQSLWRIRFTMRRWIPK